VEQCAAAGLFYALLTVNGLPAAEFCYASPDALPTTEIAKVLRRDAAACPVRTTDRGIAACLGPNMRVVLIPEAYRLVIETVP